VLGGEFPPVPHLRGEILAVVVGGGGVVWPRKVRFGPLFLGGVFFPDDGFRGVKRPFLGHPPNRSRVLALIKGGIKFYPFFHLSPSFLLRVKSSSKFVKKLPPKLLPKGPPFVTPTFQKFLPKVRQYSPRALFLGKTPS